ncbi:MAG: Cys-tRNA(Pro) deacylase [Eggerthellaceae bacterium]|nr:Cys-tRNA(Pro) deacylase [Eggerthellaceae bacterium]
MLMKKQLEKTQVMRILDQAGVAYESYCYIETGVVSGLEVAEVLGQDPDQVFKTLVTVGHTGEHYVFVVPVSCELDLKKAADAVGEKSIHMIKSKELLGLTGYIHGGCSPIGMKKQFVTVVDETAELYDTICFSAGRIGYQVQMSVEDLGRIVPIRFADITCA